MYSFIFEDFWTKFGLKLLFTIPSVLENFASFCSITFFFIFVRKFTPVKFKILYLFQQLSSTIISHGNVSSLKMASPKRSTVFVVVCKIIRIV